MAGQNHIISSTGAHQTPVISRSHYSDSELEYFRQLVLNKKLEVIEEIERLSGRLDKRENLDTDSAYSLHLGDAAADSFERERTYVMMEHQNKLIYYLDQALERINRKTYGICRVTGKPIAKERLEAIPHTDISVEAKMEQQLRWGR
jgi:DnaK suppressor protein